MRQHTITGLNYSSNFHMNQCRFSNRTALHNDRSIDVIIKCKGKGKGFFFYIRINSYLFFVREKPLYDPYQGKASIKLGHENTKQGINNIAPPDSSQLTASKRDTTQS